MLNAYGIKHIPTHVPIQDSLKEPIIADADSYVSYLEGCTAPYDENTLHAAVVELVTHDRAEIKYSTVQTGNPEMKMA